MSKKLYKPSRNIYQDTLIVAPYPYGGVPANTDSRMQATADLFGGDILGVQATGTGKTTIDLVAKRALSPARFSATSDREADVVAPYAADYERIIGWGDSGRGATIMGIQIETGIFDRLLLRDGYNLRAPQNLPAGWLNFIAYQLSGERQKPALTDDIPPPSPAGVSPFESIALGLTEMTHYSKLMRSRYTLDAAMELAGDPHFANLPIRSVGLTNTFTGSAMDAIVFAETLTDMRTATTQHLGPLAVIAEVHANVEEGYHSDLLRPGMAARHLEETLALAPAYTL